jgi:hypothetical protein
MFLIHEEMDERPVAKEYAQGSISHTGHDVFSGRIKIKPK